MKQHMMTHKLRDVPQHMFSNNKLDQSRNHSPDSAKDTPSLRVKSESELNPRAATTPDRFESRERERERERDRDRERDRERERERSLQSQFQSQVDSNYQMMLERQHHLEQMQRQHQLQQSRHSPLHLQRQSLSALSPPQHIKNELTSRQKPSSTDEPPSKRQLCKFHCFHFHFSFFFNPEP